MIWSYKDPDVLYYKATGTNTTLTLSNSISNYEYIEIFYSTGGNTKAGCQSQKIYKPKTGESISLTTGVTYSNYLYIRVCRAKFDNETTISFDGPGQFVFNGSSKAGAIGDTDSPPVYIYRILGYK